MRTVYFLKLDWESNYEYKYYLDVYVSEPANYFINVLNIKGNLVKCKIIMVSNTHIMVISDKVFEGRIVFTPKPSISKDGDKIKQIKNEIAEYDKTIEEMYKNNAINSSAYYAMKGFNIVLNEIINEEE